MNALSRILRARPRVSRYRSANGRPRRHEPTQASFWWAYALLLVSVTALVHAWRSV